MGLSYLASETTAMVLNKLNVVCLLSLMNKAVQHNHHT